VRIKIELKFSKNQIEFLDTITVLDNGFLKTKLYEKPTDKHMYLHKRSDHPKTVKKSIPYGLGVRVKRICDDKEEYEFNLVFRKFKFDFYSRVYRICQIMEFFSV
jgi:hypothetical protein